ncbi:MAG: hypothetical protein JXB49_24125 [Bacteroidales bacterium]|nr:hypothetical protein [Bacteroidales bacterium]
MQINIKNNKKTIQFTLQIIYIIGLTLNFSCTRFKKPENFDNPNVIIVHANDLGYGDIEYGKIKANVPPCQLYDLDSDLAQKIILCKVRSDKVNELKALLEVFFESYQSGICGKKTKRKSNKQVLKW